jgi:hypothetical protein
MFLPDSTDLSDGLRRCVRSALALHSSQFASPVSAEAGRDGFAPINLVRETRHVTRKPSLSPHRDSRIQGVSDISKL